VAKVHAQENNEHRGCTSATLKGAYGFYRSATRTSDPTRSDDPLVAIVAIGIGSFDGTGAVASARQTIRRNGVITADLFTGPAAEGPYEVFPDCTGRFLNPDGSVLAHFVVVDGGKEIFFTSLTPGVTSVGVQRKVE
jgi:hypothetical protein